jgi:flagellar basal-body rod protein FlgB
MFEGSSFGKTVDILHRSLDVETLRRQVIADNIANADVPNFKRSTVNFESSLKRALDSENIEPSLKLAVTHPGHIGDDSAIDYRSVKPRRVLDYLTTAKNNGNNVDAEEEAMASLRNQLMYTLETQAINFEFGQVNLVLK